MAFSAVESPALEEDKSSVVEAVAITIAFLLGYCVAAYRFIEWFPNTYVWSEDLLNYSGGFVRRGLLGEIAFVLDPAVSAKYLVAGTVLVVYALTTYWYVRAVYRRKCLGYLLLLFSPATLFFPIFEFLAFGRKDIFIIAALILTVTIARRWPHRAYLCSIAIYSVCGLIIDAAIFYYPVAMALVVYYRRPETGFRRVALDAAASLVFMILFSVVMAWFGEANGAARSAIIESWRHNYPTVFAGNNAAHYLGLSLRESYAYMRSQLDSAIVLRGYAGILILAALPFAVLIYELKFPRISIWLALCFGGAFISALVPFVLAADWGRYIYLLVMQAGIVCLCMGLPDSNRRSLSPVAFSLALVIYALTWQMAHYVHPGTSPLRAGPLLAAVVG